MCHPSLGTSRGGRRVVVRQAARSRPATRTLTTRTRRRTHSPPLRTCTRTRTAARRSRRTRRSSRGWQCRTSTCRRRAGIPTSSTRRRRDLPVAGLLLAGAGDVVAFHIGVSKGEGAGDVVAYHIDIGEGSGLARVTKGCVKGGSALRPHGASMLSPRRPRQQGADQASFLQKPPGPAPDQPAGTGANRSDSDPSKARACRWSLQSGCILIALKLSCSSWSSGGSMRATPCTAASTL